jgi:hypothetical protein
MIYRLQQLPAVPRILYKGFPFSSKRAQYFMEETSQNTAWGTNGTTIGPKGISGL